MSAAMGFPVPVPLLEWQQPENVVGDCCLPRCENTATKDSWLPVTFTKVTGPVFTND
jgi:hypothetical protein